MKMLNPPAFSRLQQRDPAEVEHNAAEQPQLKSQFMMSQLRVNVPENENTVQMLYGNGTKANVALSYSIPKCFNYVLFF